MQMVHHSGRNLEQPGQVIWNRRYQYALDSNRLLATSLPSDPANLPDYVATPGYSARYTYDSTWQHDFDAPLAADELGLQRPIERNNEDG